MNLLCDYKLKKDVLGELSQYDNPDEWSCGNFSARCGRADRAADGGGFYMVFTSIHEVMIHNEKSADPEELKKVLEDTVNETTPPEDFLTYQIYHYDLETGSFSVL